MTDELRNFLELNLPKVKEGKKAKFSVGVMEPKVGSHITEATGIPCQSNEYVQELLRAVRLHFDQFIDQLKVMDFLICFTLCSVNNTFSVSCLLTLFL
jgi:nucleolar protein 56